jgi:hypothetical protein
VRGTYLPTAVGTITSLNAPEEIGGRRKIQEYESLVEKFEEEVRGNHLDISTYTSGHHH